MGCDIHLFIEYRNPGNSSWSNLGAQFRLGRHYGVFSSLADVRNYGGQITPVDAPRGVPSDIGYRTRDDYHYFVCETPSADGKEVTRELALRWVENGSSTWAGDFHITDPDAHSGTWLTPDEYERAINFTLEGKVIRDTEDYKAVLAAMRSLEQSGFEVRTVFWFDN